MYIFASLKKIETTTAMFVNLYKRKFTVFLSAVTMDGLGMTYALLIVFVDGIGILEAFGFTNRFGFFELSEMRKMLGY